MKPSQTINDIDEHIIHESFPTPIYITHREQINSPFTEKSEIEEITSVPINNCRYYNGPSSLSRDDYIFNTRLHNLKEFCEKHIKNYVKKVINPKEDIDFYITQSWLNMVESGGASPSHFHPNSIISGVYYVSTMEGDGIIFRDPNSKIKLMSMYIETKDSSRLNSESMHLPVKTHDLLLFPSWLEHGILENEAAAATSANRISIAFNTFARGKFGDSNKLNELVLL